MSAGLQKHLNPPIFDYLKASVFIWANTQTWVLPLCFRNTGAERKEGGGRQDRAEGVSMPFKLKTTG